MLLGCPKKTVVVAAFSLPNPFSSKPTLGRKKTQQELGQTIRIGMLGADLMFHLESEVLEGQKPSGDAAACVLGSGYPLQQRMVSH